MNKRDSFFTKEQSLTVRGIAILLVMLSHYVQWYSGFFASDDLQYALSRCGVYGVNLFFLVSGYGLARGLENERPGFSFLWKRLKNTYVPYLLIVGVIEVSAGGLGSVTAWFQYLTGKEYWFIRCILCFYLFLFAVFWITRNGWLRVMLMTALVCGYCRMLYLQGYADFWYISNFAFPIGILLGLKEKRLLSVLNRGFWLWWVLFLLFMGYFTKEGIQVRMLTMPNDWKARHGLWINLVWTFLALQSAALLRGRYRFLPFLGKMSLELYLLHVFLYYRVVNAFEATAVVHILTALCLTLLLSLAVNRILGRGWRLLERACPIFRGKEKR